MKAKAYARYYIRIDKVVCPKCGKDMISPERDWWMCDSIKCDFSCFSEELELVFPKKEKSK